MIHRTAAFVLAVMCLCSGADAAPEHKAIYGMYDDEIDRAVDVGEIYGTPVSYFLAAPVITLDVGVRAGCSSLPQTIRVDLAQHVRRALENWKRAGFQFRLSGSEIEPAGHGINIVVANDWTQGLGWTNFHRTSPTRVHINQAAIQRCANFQALRDLGAIRPDMALQEYLEMTVFLTVSHEFGHALGLGHSDPPAPGYELIVTPTNIRQAPSLMLSGVSQEQIYILELSRFLRRHVVLADIGPSRNDIQGANIMLRGGERNSGVTRLFLALCLAFVTCTH